MDVFETFKEQKRPLSLSEIADEINTPISKCREIVRTLQDLGYLHLANSGSFYPTSRIVACARAVAANDPIVQRLARGPVGIAVAGPLIRMEDNFERTSLLLLDLLKRAS